MSDTSDNIDQLFQNHLERHEKKPGKDVWEEINKTLDRDDHLRYLRKIQRVTWMASALLLLMFCIPLSSDKFLLKNAGLFKLSSSDREQEISRLPIKSNTIVNAPQASFAGQIPRDRKNKKAFFTSDEFSKFFISDSPAHFIERKVLYDMPDAVGIKSSTSPKVKAGNISGPLKTLTQLKTISRFSITPYFSKDFAGYNFSDHDITGVNGREIESRERNIFAASAGIYLNYQLSRKWVIQSGISYSWSNNRIDSANSYAVKNDEGIVQFQFNTASGYSYLNSPGTFIPVPGDSISTAQTYTRLRHLTIPVLLSYKIPFGRFSILAGGGLTFNVLTNASLQTVIYGHGYKEDQSEIAIHGLKKVIIGVLVKAELEYRFADRWAVEVIPSFRNTLSPVLLNSTVSAYPFNFGIGAGIHIRF